MGSCISTRRDLYTVPSLNGDGMTIGTLPVPHLPDDVLYLLFIFVAQREPCRMDWLWQPTLRFDILSYYARLGWMRLSFILSPLAPCASQLHIVVGGRRFSCAAGLHTTSSFTVRPGAVECIYTFPSTDKLTNRVDGAGTRL